MEQCRIQVENVFGPQVSDCYNNFDFTLLFEESVLYLPALLIASILGCWRLWRLQSRTNILGYRGVLWYLKQVSASSSIRETDPSTFSHMAFAHERIFN